MFFFLLYNNQIKCLQKLYLAQKDIISNFKIFFSSNTKISENLYLDQKDTIIRISIFGTRKYHVITYIYNKGKLFSQNFFSTAKDLARKKDLSGFGTIETSFSNSAWKDKVSFVFNIKLFSNIVAYQRNTLDNLVKSINFKYLWSYWEIDFVS